MHDTEWLKILVSALVGMLAGFIADLYTQAISSQKREANAKVVEMLLPAGGKRGQSQHHSAPSREEKEKVEAISA